MESIKGILFDKDGTLIEFHSLWLRAAKEVLAAFIIMNNLKLDSRQIRGLWNAIGVEEEIIRQDGALAYKTYAGIGADIAKYLITEGIMISKESAGKQIENLFESVLQNNSMEYRETCDLHRLFHELKKRKIKIGLATADNEPVSRICLEKLGIIDQFDYLGWDDGKRRPKPAPDLLLDFCEQFHLNTWEVAVVGDTVNDMRFAKENGALAIGTLSGIGTKEELQKEADVIVNHPLEVIGKKIEVLGGKIWQI